MATRRIDSASSYSRWLTACSATSGCNRVASRLAWAMRASAAATSAVAVVFCACSGRGSSWNSRAPFATSVPSTKWRLSRKPLTRARISTSREPSVRPRYSNVIGTSVGDTVATVTGVGGIAGISWPGWWRAQAPSTASAAREGARRAVRLDGCMRVREGPSTPARKDTFMHVCLQARG